MVSMGMIHGRFQPFHNGHFDYLKAALRYAHKLVVGITNPEPNAIGQVASDSHRHLAEANPFSYYLRARMVQESILLDSELKNRLADVIIVPFPINKPERWKYYVPMAGVTQFMRVLDPWDNEKKRLFETHGYEVSVLNGLRLTSGSKIRKAIAANDKVWQQEVPFGTVVVLQAYLSTERPEACERG